MLDNDTKYLKKYIWKVKVPLNIKVFMWFFHGKLILTKDNLLKRNWNGMNNVVLWYQGIYIYTIFIFECPLAMIIWCTIHMTFDLEPPKNVTNLFGNWLNGISKEDLFKFT
jgi:hypothetical protein